MASMVRIPNPCRARSSSTSRPVMMTAHSSGIWNNRLRATALPKTSARSQAPMATSLINQLGQRVHLGYQSRQHCARSFPVTTPRRAEMTCMKMAIKLARPTTHKSPYLNWAPPCRSVPQLPGSMYPTLTKIAGPTKARHCSQNPAVWCGTSTELWTSSRDEWPPDRASAAGRPEPTGALICVWPSASLMVMVQEQTICQPAYTNIY